MSLFTRDKNKLFSEPDNLKEKAENSGISQTPTTPYSAAGIGATPQEAAMAGSGAQKKAIINNPAPAKEDTLAGFQRLQQPRQEQTSVEDQARQKAEEVRKLGALDLRVQSLIEQRIAQQTVDAGASVRNDALAASMGLTADQVAGQAPDSQYTLVQTELNNLAANPTGPATEQAYVNLLNLGLNPQSAQNLIDTTTANIGTQLGANIADTLTLGEVNPVDLGFQDMNEIASILGIDPTQAASLTMPELTQLAEDLRQREYQRINTMRAEINNLPLNSPRRQQLMQEMRDLGQVGVSGTEQAVGQTVQDIRMSDQVNIGGQSMTLDQALSDEHLSRLVERYLETEDPELREQILPSDTYGELRTWVEQNKQALSQVSAGLQAEGEAVNQTQEAYKGLTAITPNVSLANDVLSALIGYDPEKAVTAGELATMEQQLDASSVGQIANDTAMDNELKEGILRGIHAGNIDFVKGKTKDQLVKAYEAAQDINTDPLLAELVGAEVGANFIKDEGTITSIGKYKEAINNLKEAGHADFLSNPAFKELSADEMNTLAANPDRYDNFETFNEVTDTIDNATTTDEVLNVLMGDANIDSRTLADTYAKLNRMARVGDTGAIELKAILTPIMDLVSTNNTQGLKDYLSTLKGGVSVEDVIGGAGGAVSLMQKLQELGKKGVAAQSETFDNTLMAQLADLTEDNELSLDELTQFPEEKQRELYEMVNNLPEINAAGYTKGLPYEKFREDYIVGPQELESVNTLVNEVEGSVIGDGYKPSTITNQINHLTKVKSKYTTENAKNQIQKRIDSLKGMVKPAEAYQNTKAAADKNIYNVRRVGTSYYNNVPSHYLGYLDTDVSTWGDAAPEKLAQLEKVQDYIMSAYGSADNSTKNKFSELLMTIDSIEDAYTGFKNFQPYIG